MLSVRKTKGGRPDSNRDLEDHDLGCCRYTTTTMRADAGFAGVGFDHRHIKTEIERREIIMARGAGRIFRRSGDDRTRTGACSPDKRVLFAAELRPLA